jgi:hypothetical protein
MEELPPLYVRFFLYRQFKNGKSMDDEVKKIKENKRPAAEHWCKQLEAGNIKEIPPDWCEPTEKVSSQICE